MAMRISKSFFLIALVKHVKRPKVPKTHILANNGSLTHIVDG